MDGSPISRVSGLTKPHAAGWTNRNMDFRSKTIFDCKTLAFQKSIVFL